MQEQTKESDTRAELIAEIQQELISTFFYPEQCDDIIPGWELIFESAVFNNPAEEYTPEYIDGLHWVYQMMKLIRNMASLSKLRTR